MIDLTDSTPISSVIGGTGKTGYDRLTLATMTFTSSIPPAVNAQVSVTASNVPDAPPLTGVLTVTPGAATVLAISVPGLQAFPSNIKLDSAQNDALTKISQDARAALEQMLIDLGVVSGTIGK